MLAEIKTFIAVCRYGTFAAAGDRLGLTQSAVSSQIRRLEDFLGFQLFDRTGRAAHLNAHGRRTLQRAQDLTAQFERLGDPDDDELAPESALKIGAISSIQPSIVARAISHFQPMRPRQRIRVIPGTSLYLMNQLDTGEIDAAIMIKPPFGMIPDFQWLPLTMEPFFLATPENIAGGPWKSLISENPFIRYERTSFAGRQVDRFLQKHHVHVRESIEMDEVPAMLALVAQGAGVALVPQVEAYRPFLDGVNSIHLGPDVFHREIGVAVRELNLEHPGIQQFIDCVTQAVLPRHEDGAPHVTGG